MCFANSTSTYSEEFSPARTSIRPATGKTETNGVARENGSSLTVDEFKAINEAVQAFGGVAHKFGDALRDVLGKTSGVEFTFTDFAPLRMRDHPVTPTPPLQELQPQHPR